MSELSDHPDVRGALGSIGVSSLLMLGGAVLSRAMGAGTRVVMARFLPVDGYGQVVLGITVLNLLGIVSLLGLGRALSRYIPRGETRAERTEVVAVVYQMGMTLSVFWGVVGFLGAEPIARLAFDRPQMTGIIRVFALSLPFYVAYKLSLNGIRGHKSTLPRVLTDNLVLPIGRLGGVAILAVGGFGAVGLAVGYNVGFVVAGVVGFLFLLRQGSHPVGSLVGLADRERYREVMAFALPVAATASFSVIARQSDVVLLGVFTTSAEVGVYDTAFLVAQFVMFFSPALSYLLAPVLSEYDSEGANARMDALYTVVTRWLVVLSFPIFALLVLVPGGILGATFGSDYRVASTALGILAVAFFLTRLVGFSGEFLTAVGDTKVLMYTSVTSSALNVGLNVALIPFYGVVGAALATAAARTLNNVLQSAYIFRTMGIHPFERELVVPTGVILLCLGVTDVFLLGGSTSLVVGGGAVAGLSILYGVCVLATRSVYPVELELLDSLLNRLGVPVRLADRLSGFTRRR